MERWIGTSTAVVLLYDNLMYTVRLVHGGENALPSKDVGRHVKQGKTCAVKGLAPKYSILKPSSLVSVTACQGKAAVCQGLKVLSPDIFAPQCRQEKQPTPRLSCWPLLIL